MQLLSPNASDNGILFGTAASAVSGGILYNAAGNKGFLFRTNGNSTKMVIDSSGNVGIGTTAPAFKLQVSTNSAAKPTSNTWTIASDARLKTNVHDYKEGLDALKKIHPVWFTYTGEAGMPKETGVGVLAQELKEVAPYMVGTWNYLDDNNKSTEYLSVDNGAMTYMLINSVKELDSKVQSSLVQSSKLEQLEKENQALKNKIEEMSACLETLCNNSLETKTQNSELTTLNYLEQNNPNPFKENTTIGFYISSNSSKGLLKIFSMNGEEIKSFVISTIGKSQIEISGYTLAPGVYTYVLIVDDKTVDTKQMVVTK
ncbi:MAG: tail fiber domain-containing protein [Bacteroidetes bacterium]|nr:tail fiber domain-containing protein [Bacteroidota bacterium]